MSGVETGWRFFRGQDRQISLRNCGGEMMTVLNMCYGVSARDQCALG